MGDFGMRRGGLRIGQCYVFVYRHFLCSVAHFCENIVEYCHYHFGKEGRIAVNKTDFDECYGGDIRGACKFRTFALSP